VLKEAAVEHEEEEEEPSAEAVLATEGAAVASSAIESQEPSKHGVLKEAALEHEDEEELGNDFERHELSKGFDFDVAPVSESRHHVVNLVSAASAHEPAAQIVKIGVGEVCGGTIEIPPKDAVGCIDGTASSMQACARSQLPFCTEHPAIDVEAKRDVSELLPAGGFQDCVPPAPAQTKTLGDGLKLEYGAGVLQLVQHQQISLSPSMTRGSSLGDQSFDWELSWVFEVSPPLPQGLTIDPGTGQIRGVPSERTSGASRHIIKACCSNVKEIGSAFNIAAELSIQVVTEPMPPPSPPSSPPFRRPICSLAAEHSPGPSRCAECSAVLQVPHARREALFNAVRLSNVRNIETMAERGLLLPWMVDSALIVDEEGSTILGRAKNVGNAKVLRVLFRLLTSDLGNSAPPPCSHVSKDPDGFECSTSEVPLRYESLPSVFVCGSACRFTPRSDDQVALEKIEILGLSVFTVRPDLPDGLELDSRSGVLRGTPTLERSHGSYIVSFFARDDESKTLLRGTCTLAFSVSANMQRISYPRIEQLLEEDMSAPMPPLPPRGQLPTTGFPRAQQSRQLALLLPPLAFTATSMAASATTTKPCSCPCRCTLGGNYLGRAASHPDRPEVGGGVGVVVVAKVGGTATVVASAGCCRCFSVAPRVEGGFPDRFDVSPPLPYGMSLNSQTGTVCGAPISHKGFVAFRHTIVAENSIGSTACHITIEAFQSSWGMKLLKIETETEDAGFDDVSKMGSLPLRSSPPSALPFDRPPRNIEAPLHTQVSKTFEALVPFWCSKLKEIEEANRPAPRHEQIAAWRQKMRSELSAGSHADLL